MNASSRQPSIQPARRTRRERGQSLVELALVLPVFLVIVMATIDFGWAFNNYITVTNAAREGARLGAIGSTKADIESKATAKAPSGATATATGAGGASGSEVKVKVEYNYTYIPPLGGLLSLLSGGSVSNSINLASETSMRIE